MPERRLPLEGPLHSPWNTEQPTHRATHRAEQQPPTRYAALSSCLVQDCCALPPRPWDGCSASTYSLELLPNGRGHFRWRRWTLCSCAREVQQARCGTCGRQVQAGGVETRTQSSTRGGAASSSRQHQHQHQHMPWRCIWPVQHGARLTHSLRGSEGGGGPGDST
jgi:hypothetical protein